MQEEAAPKDSASKSEANSKSQTMLSLQNKIQSQAKRLCSMQDYITTLESTIKEHKINSNNKSQNESLIEELKEENISLKQKMEEYEKNFDNFGQNMDLINRLNNENNNLYNQNIMMNEELENLKDQNYLIGNNLLNLQKENEFLKIKLTELSNENNSLIDYKLGYDLVLKENEELKNINSHLSNNIYALKTNLDKLAISEKNNTLIKSELNSLKEVLNNLKNNKKINNVFEHISSLEKKNKFLEEKLKEKEEKNSNNNSINKKEYINNVIDKYDNKNEKYKNKDNKYILANKYYSDLLLRILKYHIKDDTNIKNILFQLLDLNHKKIILLTNIENLYNEKNYKDVNKKRNIINQKKKELDNVNNTIDYFDKELIKFE